MLVARALKNSQLTGGETQGEVLQADCDEDCFE
jgi:hypothetical protein